MITINADRLLNDLDTLRSHGATGTGVVRPSLSAIDMQAREWLCGRFADAGLQASIDGIGTVLARNAADGAALLIGSHTDTQPTGGWLDGALGVIYGLEVARTLAENPATRELPVSVASWIDEESTYFGCLGSKSFTGAINPLELTGVRNANGERLQTALERCGIAGRSLHHVSDRAYRGYLEAHIEQGPWLESSARRIGVVSDIVGSRNLNITYIGQQNHAGTTPMAMRRDAGQAVFRFANAVNKIISIHGGDRTVWTLGKLELVPNAPSIIPGQASCVFQFRDPDNALLDDLLQRVLDCARQSAGDGIEADIHIKPDQAVGVAMDGALQQHLCDAAEKVAPNDWVLMPSGAVHDAQVLAAVMPAGMLFVPSIGGISHAFEEDTRRDDICLGCQVLLDASIRILNS